MNEPTRGAFDHHPVYLVKDPVTQLLDGYYVAKSSARDAAAVWEKRLGRKMEVNKIMPGHRFYLEDHHLLNHNKAIMNKVRDFKIV